MASKEPSKELRDLSIALANNQRSGGASPAATAMSSNLATQSTPQTPSTPDTYKVQSGDTLSSIASRLGVGVNDLTGYRSGDPNLIFPGENISINRPQQQQADSGYNDLVRDELMGDEGQGRTERTNYTQEVSRAQQEREKAYRELESLTTRTFDQQYKERGLDKKKEQMSELDNEIARLRAEREEAVNKVRTNPGLSAAQMAGDVKKMADFQNAKINNVIAQRNGLAQEYNNELGTIDRLVQNTVQDAQMKFGYWDQLAKENQQRADRYDELLREEFMSDREQDNFEKQMAQQLQIAGMRGSGGSTSVPNLQLVRDPVTNEPFYWWNPQTGETQYLNQTETGSGGTAPQSFENIGRNAEEEESKPGFWRGLWNRITGN